MPTGAHRYPPVPIGTHWYISDVVFWMSDTWNIFFLRYSYQFLFKNISHHHPSPERTFWTSEIAVCQLLDYESTHIGESFPKFSAKSVEGNLFFGHFNPFLAHFGLEWGARGVRGGHWRGLDCKDCLFLTVATKLWPTVLLCETIWYISLVEVNQAINPWQC